MEYSMKNMYYCYSLRAAHRRVMAKTPIRRELGVVVSMDNACGIVSMKSFWLAASKAER